jgi:hypothetical protein
MLHRAVHDSQVASPLPWDLPTTERSQYMNTPAFRPDDSPWKGSYVAALFQDDTTKIPALIARAESQITERARMLYEAPVDNAPELRALNNALRMLQVLKTCVKRATSEEITPTIVESHVPQAGHLSA